MLTVDIVVMMLMKKLWRLSEFDDKKPGNVLALRAQRRRIKLRGKPATVHLFLRIVYPVLV
jgi:hypothetical protein